MNNFEEAISNVPYSTEWYDMRCSVAHIFEQYLQQSEWHHIYEKSIGDTTIRCVVMYLFDSLYVWTDTVEDGKIESSQLDIAYSNHLARVIYCNVSTAPPFAPILFNMIDNREITQIC